jgi:hypothetical protein
MSPTAALPPAGYEPPSRLVTGDGRLTVRVFPESGDPPADFDFAGLPLAMPLRVSLAEAFAKVTGPAGTRRTHISAKGLMADLRLFATVLADAAHPPESVAELTAVHANAIRLSVGAARARQLSGLRVVCRALSDVPDSFVARLNIPLIQAAARSRHEAYSQQEFERVAAAARDDLRAAADRIRGNRELLRRWREGELDPERDHALWRRSQVLDHVDRSADVPRGPSGNSSVGDVGRLVDLVTALHLTLREVGAFAVLFACMTGQNASTLQRLQAEHHRADGRAPGAIGVALVDLVKPRRGRHRAHLTVPLTDLPAWLGAPDRPPAKVSGHSQLHTPFGLYLLALELTASSRAVLGTDRLLVYWSVARGGGHRQGLWLAGHELVSYWGRVLHPVRADGLDQPPLVLDSRRLRRTYVELHQKPVAHTEQTLASRYLLRNRRSLGDYQRVVAMVLEEQVRRARTGSLALTMTAADVAAARTDPDAMAERFHVDRPTLERLLAGRLDTVLTACVDHTNGPHAPAGQPCTASFLLCLSCRCARVEPRHLPILVVARDALEARRADLDPLTWAERYATAHAQLTDLLDQFPQAAVAAAGRGATEGERQLVARLLNRELDRP